MSPASWQAGWAARGPAASLPGWHSLTQWPAAPGWPQLPRHPICPSLPQPQACSRSEQGTLLTALRARRAPTGAKRQRGIWRRCPGLSMLGPGRAGKHRLLRLDMVPEIVTLTQVGTYKQGSRAPTMPVVTSPGHGILFPGKARLTT